MDQNFRMSDAFFPSVFVIDGLYLDCIDSVSSRIPPNLVNYCWKPLKSRLALIFYSFLRSLLKQHYFFVVSCCSFLLALCPVCRKFGHIWGLHFGPLKLLSKCTFFMNCVRLKPVGWEPCSNCFILECVFSATWYTYNTLYKYVQF